MNFRVGQKVVCISDDWFCQHPIVFPIKGRIYTVRGKNLEPHNAVSPVGLYLVEIVNTVFGARENAFDAEGFRPLVEKKTDISIFTHMLSGSPVRISEDV